jgi:glycosyltransferase involved in cell wall biosynthesis
MPHYRLLILATRHAIPPDSGYATDVHGAVEQLVRQGVEVRVLLVDDGKAHPTDYPASLLTGVVPLTPWRRATAMAKALLTRKAYVACKWSIPEVVDHACRLHAEWPFDLVQACGLFHMENALAIRRRCGVKVVLRSQNVESAICQRMAEAASPGFRRSIWKREAALLRKQEATWCRNADLCLPISETDGVVLKAFAPQTPTVVVQTGVTLPDVDPILNVPATPACFLHVGSLEWLPRREGFMWFLKEVWPLVRALIPEARLLVVGSVSDSLRDQLSAWRNQGVDVRGYLDDLEGLARSCVAVVVPMRCGGGIKIRVITAWANGWPVVGTKGMGEGLPARDGVNCLMADEPAALASALQRVTLDQNLRDKLIRAGREASRDHFSWETIGRILQSAHESCLEI